MTNPAPEVVGRFLLCLGRRDLGAALDLWHSEGRYHVTGSHTDAGDRTAQAYVEFLATWFDRFPDYVVDDFQLAAWGEDVAVVHLVTRGGPATGVASGLMVFRVEDGLITEGWGIPTFAGGSVPF